MLADMFGSRGFRALEGGLGALSLRHRVIANNIANSNTPGFKKSEVSFARELAAFLEAGGGGAGGGAGGARFQPRVLRVDTTAQRVDGNNVDVEEEMAKLAENTLLYQAVSRRLSGKISLLRLAITEGRR